MSPVNIVPHLPITDTLGLLLLLCIFMVVEVAFKQILLIVVLTAVELLDNSIFNTAV